MQVSRPLRACASWRLHSGRQVWAAARWRGDASTWVPILLGLGQSVATAYLVVTGSWQIALGLILILPAVIALHKYPFLALLVWLTLAQFFVVTPTSAERMVYWVLHRALPPATIGIIALSHAVGINKRTLPRLGWAELAMAGYVAVSLMSIILLNDTPQATAYRFYDRVISPMCLYLLVRLSVPNEKELQRLIVAAFFVAAVQSIIGLLSWIAPQVLPPQWLGKLGERTIGSLINPSTYTSTLIFCGLLILQAALHRKPGLARILYVFTFVLAMFCVFLSFSRASWIGGLLAILGVIYLYPKSMSRLGFVAVPVVIIVVSAGLLSAQFSFANQRLNSDNTALDRLPTYYAAYLMFQEKPFLGWGYANFERYDRRFQGRVLDLANDNKDHANHSAYLTLIAEQGLIGSVLFLAPLFWWLILTLKVLPRMPAEGFWSRKLLILLWLAILNIFVVNNFTPAWVAFGHGVWWLTLGLIAHMVYTYGAAGDSGSTRAHRRGLA